MKNLILSACIALMATSVVAQENIQPIAIGTTIPMATTKMKATDGKHYSIRDVAGKAGVLVMFSCNTCPYVVRYQERTRETIKEAKEKGFGVIIINSNEGMRSDEDSYEAMMAYANNQGYKNVPYVVDEKSKLANAFGATRTPELFLFDATGKLVYHGAIDDNHLADKAQRKHAKLAMEEVRAGHDVSLKETRSVGCTIKRTKG
ncbi:thioredoxin family protein [Aridibaculum aurantiacum]|uniref:thioredoxin family protein n=1 Tax=Aridibaculum aurantiacum TaxID=2810307 RepID=UPI001A97A634|nr:thioredoxin family protein [Aridibaculum aurantiacum]